MARAYAYASLPDVQSKVLYFTITGTSKPAASHIADYLDGASDELDAKLKRRGFVTPIPTTAVEALNVLNEWAAVGAAMQTAAALPQGEDSKHLKYLERRWNAILKSIDEGDFELPGAEVVASGTGRMRVGKPDSESDPPYFSRNEDV